MLKTKKLKSVLPDLAKLYFLGQFFDGLFSFWKNLKTAFGLLLPLCTF